MIFINLVYGDFLNNNELIDCLFYYVQYHNDEVLAHCTDEHCADTELHAQ